MWSVLLPSEREAAEFCRAAARNAYGPAVRTAVTGHRNDRWVQMEPTLQKGNIIVAGTAGAIDPELELGDVFLPYSVEGASGIPLYPSAALREYALDSLAVKGIFYKEGILFSSPSPVITGADKAKAAERGFAAVDMESWWLLSLLAKKGWNSVVVRVITDRADEGAAHDYKTNLERASAALSSSLAALVDNA
jgi:nucleoside phosphorylase